MDCLYIVMPAYNEEDSIKEVIDSWYPIIENSNADSRLVVADSLSTDNTHDVLLKMKENYPKLTILSDTDKQHGPKVIALYKYAIENNADYIFQTDSDGQTDPKEFESFWNLKNNYDAILGNRTVRGDGKSRKFVENTVCKLLKLFFGINVPDANAPFRLMKTDLVSKYIDRLPDDYNLPNIMLTTYFSYYKEKLLFKEISFKPRQAGANSINIPKIVKIGFNSLKDFYRFRKEM